ncbi:hypothetical protein BC941DRAFT_417556 [Chlamydoabsidia padenii]|nr:hypothetical protein BC941DRAFT_417556 [Chlamydoabsidia padenii]
MSAPTVDEFNQLRAQNEQLWKIIERQRTMIQSLQKENSHLAAERDGLQDNVNTFERARKQRASVLFSPEALKAMMTETEDEPSPMPPPRSPYRSNSGKPEHQPLKAHKEHIQRQKGKQLNFSLDTSDTTLSTSLQQTPTSPRNVILEKDAQHVQKFKTCKPASPSLNTTSPSFIMPMSSVSSPIATNTPIDEASLSSSFSSSTSSFLRPNSPPDFTLQRPGGNNNSNNNNRSKRESHIFFSPPPILPPPPPPPAAAAAAAAVAALDGSTMVSSSDLGEKQIMEPTAGLPQHSMSSASATTTVSSLSSNSSTTSAAAGPFVGGITNIAVKVLGSNIRQNEKSREVISFIISVGKKPDEFNMEYEELWRVEKLYSHFLELDSKLKSGHRSVANRIAKLPDKALFTTNSPSKVDRRKAALEQYLHHIVLLPLEDSSDLCEFLSTNVVDNDVMYSRTGRKEGYLTKRGKNFGGWKTRYFVLHGSSLEYYESKEGNHLGTIRLINARIGRQTPGTSTDEHNTYRHAFLIVEQKRSGSSQMHRHILCAESDQERDDWVDALFKNVTLEDEKQFMGSNLSDYAPSGDNNINGTPVMKKKPTKSMSSKSATSTKSGSSHDNEFDKIRPCVAQDSNEIGVALSGPPCVINESSESLPSTWSSATLPPPPIVFDQRTSLDQPRSTYTMHLNNNNNNSSNSLQPRPSHNLTRRSSMVNLLNTENEEEIILPARAMSPSPAFGRESEELLGDDLPEKKTKHKRMTFWGKKMFNNNSSETLVVPSRPSPSSSSSTSNTNENNNINNNNSLEMATGTQTSSSGFRGFLSRPSHENGRSNSKDAQPIPQHPVFGVPLEEAVRVSRVSDTYQLPSIVFRCLEYLDAKKAILEEGLYRLSGSNIMMKSLKQRFDLEGDINLLAAKEEYDVHAIAGLLKMWLRELPTSVLTREHRMDFLYVIDLLDRKDRVNELGRLVSLLPIANYTLLRALTAHLIQVVQHSDVNKMTMRNVSIVFSPTLGIPGTIFNLLMSEFDYIFWTTEDGDAAPRMILDDENTVYETPTKVIEEEDPVVVVVSDQTPNGDVNAITTNMESGGNKLGRKPTLQLRDGRSNRNSVNYREAAPNTIVELEKHHHNHGQLMLDEIEDEVNDLALTDDDYSIVSSDDKLQATAITI